MIFYWLALTLSFARADQIATPAQGAPPYSSIVYIKSPPTLSELCNFPDPAIQANCLKFGNDPSIPHDAFMYTMNIFRQNSDTLKMKKCLLDFDSNHYSMKNQSRGELEQGIKNHCQILIYDTEDHPKENPAHRGTFHYLDLCKGTHESDYFNLGSDTEKNDFSNLPDKHSTVLGAFLTGDQTFSYEPQGCLRSKGRGRRKHCVATGLEPSYQKTLATVQRLKGVRENPSIPLFGLQNTNNGSAQQNKYLHGSPYNSSWGCPSVDSSHYAMIEELAKNGPSLVVTYGPKDKMEDPAKCSE